MIGHIHIYTGEGKGKTTAAFGLALRASGRGLRVCILQFLKGGDTGECMAIESMPNISILRNSREYGFYKFLSEQARAELYLEHTENLMQAVQLARAGQIDMLILDEALAAYNLGTLDAALLEGLVENKPEALELVLTGRDAPARFLSVASYVSEIKKIKHPYDAGIPAREGVEY